MNADTKRNFTEGYRLSLLYHIILLGIVCFFILWHHNTLSFRLFTSLWNAWDGRTYTYLAVHGYQTVGDEANYIAFYPLYPFLVRLIESFGIQVHLSGMLVTIIGSLIGHSVFFLWLRERGLTQKQARKVLFLFFINPVTVYFTMVCTEGVFLALVACFFLFLYRRSFALAAVCGLFASGTRLVGITLLIPFLLFFVENQLPRIYWKQVLLGSLIPVGFLFFLGINFNLFGDPFHYQKVLQNNWSKSVVNPVTQYIETFKDVGTFFPAQNITYTVDIISTLLAPIFLLVYIAVKRKKIWLTGVGFYAANIFIITAQSYWLSNTRYISMILPIYIFIEELTRRFFLLYSIICVIFIILSLYGISIFARGGWLY